MRTTLALSLLMTAGLIAPGAVAAESVSARPATGVLKCRSQTYTWTFGKKVALTSKLGPRVRTGNRKDPTLTDNRMNGAITPADNDPGALAAEYLNVLAMFPAGQKITRLESVTIYPVKEKKKTFKIVKNSNKDYVYKYGLLKDRGQVQLPVRGSNGTEHSVPKMNKVIVRARENCFATQ